MLQLCCRTGARAFCGSSVLALDFSFSVHLALWVEAAGRVPKVPRRVAQTVAVTSHLNWREDEESSWSPEDWQRCGTL